MPEFVPDRAQRPGGRPRRALGRGGYSEVRRRSASADFSCRFHAWRVPTLVGSRGRARCPPRRRGECRLRRRRRVARPPWTRPTATGGAPTSTPRTSRTSEHPGVDRRRLRLGAPSRGGSTSANPGGLGSAEARRATARPRPVGLRGSRPIGGSGRGLVGRARGRAGVEIARTTGRGRA